MARITVHREIDSAARIAPDVQIGEFCVVGPHATLGPGTRLGRRVSVTGHTRIGSGNAFGEGCVLGAAPQDLKYAGGDTLLIIGHHNRFGRNVTAHVGTELGGWLTRIGDHNQLDDGCHVGHDSYVDDRTHLGRNVLLAGHIRVEVGAVIGDLVGVHQFVTVGRHARVGPRTPVRRDVPPYTHYYSENYEDAPPAVRGVHDGGIAAAALPAGDEKELRGALAELFANEFALQTKIEHLVDIGVEAEAAALCEFCLRSLRGVGGRHREIFRGKIPDEAHRFLPPEYRPWIGREAS